MGKKRILVAAALAVWGSLAQAEPGTFTLTGQMTTDRALPRATLLANGKVLITGYGFPDHAAEIYDPHNRTFTPITSPVVWAVHSSTLLADGRVLLAGGYATGGGISTRAYLYDPMNQTFTGTGDMLRPHHGHSALLLPNGKVLIVGGEAERPPYPEDATAELYDPTTGQFSVAGTFAGIGNFVSATLLAGGRVLIVGYYSRRAGIYDPVAGTFSATGDAVLTSVSNAVLLNNGKVLFTGGDDNGPSDRAALYDTATGTFSLIAHMIVSRYGQTQTLLRDGTVLISGGGEPAEVYDAVTNTFSITAMMVISRYGHTATLLPDGSVLLAGGGGCERCASANSAEIYAQGAPTDRHGRLPSSPTIHSPVRGR